MSPLFALLHAQKHRIDVHCGGKSRPAHPRMNLSPRASDLWAGAPPGEGQG